MEWNPQSGGVIALHRLAHNLALVGENSFITTGKGNPDYKYQVITEEQAKEIENAVVIYPEVVYGNPLGIKRVVRWLLNTPGKIAFRIGKGEDGPDDLIFKYADIFKAKDESKVKGTLRAYEMFFDKFIDKGLERKGTCYLVKKGTNKHWHPADSICVDDYETKGVDWLIDIFNRTEVFISYDTATFLSAQAALCGCLSIVVPDKMSAAEWHTKNPSTPFGVAYGLGEILHAKNTMHLVKPELEKLEAASFEQLREFLRIVYSLCA